MGNMIPTTFFSEQFPGRPPVQILDFHAEVTGRIREMWFWMTPIGNNWYFTVRRAGTFILNGIGDDPLNYLELDSIAGDSAIGLDIAVTKGELIEVRRVNNGSGILFGPAEFLMVTEEGV